jgi:hypothetical protein
MTHKALIRKLQISCLGLDPIDPLRLLVDDVIEALTQPELCKYGQEPKSCTSSPMDCQCAIDAALAQTEQKPVAYWKEHAQGLQRDYDSLLADFQAQRTWVGLTDEEIKKIAKKHKWHEGNVEPHLMPVFRSLEAKLKEKNT